MRTGYRLLKRCIALNAQWMILALLIATSGAFRTVRAQQPDSPAVVAAESTDTSSISARGALIRSMILPGWGQSYVGAPGRGAVYFALEAGSLWMTYKTVRAVSSAKRVERWMRDTGQLEENERFGLVESREEQREDWIALSVFWMLAAGADAYVAAQLADFEEHIGVRPSASGGVQLEARVPFFGRR